MSDRLPEPYGLLIDRDRQVPFQFDGREYRGYDGDTLSTALWAEGVRVLGRSFKYHRPRGIFSLSDAGLVVETDEETNICGDRLRITAGLDARAANTRGGAANDRLAILDRFGAFTPVGFYYKAFHTPRFMFPFYERQLRNMAGLGAVNTNKPVRRTAKEYAHCDVLVIGAGPAGLAAATRAATLGARVILATDQPGAGGSLLYRYSADAAAAAHLSRLTEAVQVHDNLELRVGTIVAGHYADGWMALVDDERLTKTRAGAVIVATGDNGLPAVFRNNDLPGIMLGSAALSLIHLYGVKPCRTAVVLTNNADGYRTALDLHAAGVVVGAIVDPRADGETSAVSGKVESESISILRGKMVSEGLPASGKKGTVGVRLDSGGTLDCDGVIIEVGTAPADELIRQANGHMEYDDVLGRFVPGTLPDGVYAAGRVNGIFDLEKQIEDGVSAGTAAAVHVGISQQPFVPRPKRGTSSVAVSRCPVVAHPKGKNFVDFDEDVQVKDFVNAVQEGFDSAELMKRYTTVGMGPSQGRYSNFTALQILADARGETLAGKALTTARPFVSAVPLSHLAGRGFTARRLTPTHHRHIEAGAHIMFAGDWRRPEYYLRTGLERQECIYQEAANVRQGVGLIDLGTLGKLEINGADAAAFLERVYTGNFANLKIGRTRYGVICDESGVVIDDGVICRLAADRFYVSTTTSGSDTIYRTLQRWAIQWADLDVVLVNATGSYGAMNIAGPKSRDILKALTDVDLDPESFPYLAVREGHVAGVPARLSRVGFVGELGYEIHVPADGSLAVWDAVMEAGKDAEIRPFGVEAQRLLRLEKGHVIVSQDTDGLSNPFEAGIGWAVKFKKPFFIGKRSLQILKERPLTRTLVGFALAPDHSGTVPKECHLVIDGDAITGRVTSISWSPALRHVIGLAYVAPSQSEIGTTFSIRADRGQMISAIVVKTPFFDPDGERLK